jgi:hypothetical protein
MQLKGGLALTLALSPREREAPGERLQRSLNGDPDPALGTRLLLPGEKDGMRAAVDSDRMETT